VPGTPVSVQLPKVFKAALQPEGTDQRRLGVPKVDIPGLKLTYEGTVLDGEQGQASFYCYLAVAKAPEGRAENPRSYLRNQLQINLVDTATKTRLSWQPIDCKNRLGELNTWDKVEVDVEQEFRYVDKKGQESYQTWDGRIEFFVRREGDLYLIVGWRAPDYMIGTGENFIELAKWAPLVAGSVTVEQGAAK